MRLCVHMNRRDKSSVQSGFLSADTEAHTQKAPLTAREYSLASHERRITHKMMSDSFSQCVLVPGMMLPSLTSTVYFFTFLGLCTWWSFCRTFDPLLFSCLCVLMAIFSAGHLIMLYLYQFQFFQEAVPPGNIYASLFGISPVVQTDCSHTWMFRVNPDLEWHHFVNPIMLLVLYYTLATLIRLWLQESEDMVRLQPSCSYDHKSQIRFQHRTSTCFCEVVILREPLITYVSWLTFVFLIWSCILWMVRDRRKYSMITSPFMVFYGNLLIILQYIWSFESLQPVPGLFLKKEVPFRELGSKTLCLLSFWLLLRQFLTERRERQTDETQLSDDEASGHREMMDVLGRTVMAMLNKYWIYICGGMFFFVSFEGRIVMYKIIYMMMFLFCVALYQVCLHYERWRWMLKYFWMSVVVYTMLVLILVYTFQFESSISVWSNMTGMSREKLEDLGLEKFSVPALFTRIFIPTSFLLVCILHLHYFHERFLELTDIKSVADKQKSTISRYKEDDVKQREEEEVSEPHFSCSMTADPEPDRGSELKNKWRLVVERLTVLFLKFLECVQKLQLFIWWLLELHIIKIVSSYIIWLSVREVSLFNYVFLVSWAFALPFSQFRPLASSVCTVWTCVIVVCKMLYQLTSINPSSYSRSCSMPENYTDAQRSDMARSLLYSGPVDPANWIGFRKFSPLLENLRNNLLMLALLAFEVTIYRHQDFYRMKNNLTPPVTRTVFHNITRQHLDHGIVNCAKYFIDYFFYKFGLETCFLLAVNVIGQRMDFYAMLHAFGLIVVMYQSRRKAIARVWSKYCFFLACMLAFQYLMCIGIPPAACTDYPWRRPSSSMDSNVIKWLYFPDFHTKPSSLFLLYDFMLLLCASIQGRVFEEENVAAVQLLAGDNVEICRDLDAASFSQHNPVPDFIHCRSYLDMLKVIVFSYLFWFVLTIIFITGTTRISIFCMGYLVACFYFLIFGGELLLKPIKSILHYWDFLIAYNVFVITMKNILSVTLVANHCWLIQLFSLACTIKGYSKPEQNANKQCELPSDEAGIIWDSICFAFLLLQRRVFMSYYFLHVVADIRSSQVLASRGAELFQATIVKVVKARIEEEKKSMDLLKRQYQTANCWLPATFYDEELEASEHFYRSQPQLLQLCYALYSMLVAHSQMVCYLVIILNHMISASVATLVLPILIFLWAMLSVPRPSKRFWMTAIVYTEVTIVIKYFFQFGFFPFNQSIKLDKSKPFHPPNIIGVEKKEGYVHYDLIQLLALFFHRSILKCYGLWDEDEPRSGGQTASSHSDSEEKDASPVSTHIRLPRKPLRQSSSVSQRSARSKPGALRYTSGGQTASSHSDSEEKDASPVSTHIRLPRKPLRQSSSVSQRSCNTTEVKPVSPQKHSAAADITSSLSEDQVPEAFLVMVLIQFGTMVVDRALYLRKTVMGKVIFQVILVFGIHFWMFFILPGVTERRFSQNTVAQLWYFVKCIYFGLSAYQIRCGYPTRVLGNFLTKSYNYLNLFLFQGFRLVPFLTELRAVMDWVWTDTTLSLSSWICVEDIYAHIFVLKCWRESEKRYPQPRGQKKKKVVKYGMGGMIVMLLICIVWFPLLFMSLVKSVAGVVNKPLDVSLTITLGGFQPIFTMSAQQNQLKDVTDRDFITPSLSQSALQFLEAYTAEDVTVAELEGSSNSLWTISPPSRKNLMDVLSKEDQNLSLGAKAEFAVDKHITYLDMNTRQELIALLNGTRNKPVVIEQVFPCFIRAPSDSNAKPVGQLYSGNSIQLDLERSHNGTEDIQEWWIVDQPSAGKTQMRSESKLEKKREAGLQLYVFSDKVSPPSLGFLAGYGIMGLYASVVLVIGKFVREFFSGISHSIMFEELPCVDRILKLCTDIFLVRETGELELEEDLYAKLIFLYRSPETMIKWTREKTK
uniref:Piezo-type mechanosensitive ion channel component 2-like n=1 Tax=Sinocyclocheilus grahami TaxID=75366 RepID=A0A672M562_SINGR